MSNEIRVGVAGLTHGHVGGLIDSFRKVDGVKLVAVADATALLEGQKANFERSYVDWREMLDKEQLDALIVTSNNVESSEIAVVALGKGIPCLVEKAMAANAADADRMLAAQRESGKTLLINWPIGGHAALHEIKRRIDAGEIGHVFHMKFRNGHFGPKEIGCGPEFVAWLYDEKLNGGGAIADFGSYGAALASWYFGLPTSVSCIRGNYTKDYDVTDDHAIITLRYPKLSVVLEGTWATFGWDSGPGTAVYGKDGTFAVYGNTLKKHVARKDDEEIEVDPLPSSAEYFIECVREGKTPTGVRDPEVAANACRILDAAIIADRTGVEQKL